MTQAELMKELKAIRQDIKYIKTHMVDADTLLTPREEKILQKGVEEYRNGKAMRLEEFEEMKNADTS